MSDYTQLSFDLEFWRTIPGYEGLYKVSDQGRVRRLPNTPKCKAGRILKPYKRTNGYCVVTLANKVHEERYIHRIVAETFLGPCPENMEVNHKNGDRLDNRLKNLEYLTRLENIRYTHEVLGTAPYGEFCYNAKLTDDAVRDIRSLIGALSYAEIGKRYGVSGSTIFKIAHGRIWRHVK